MTQPRVSAATTVIAAVLGLLVVAELVVRNWSLPDTVPLLTGHAGPLEWLFYLVLPVLQGVLLLFGTILMVARVRLGRSLAIVGAALVLVTPVAFGVANGRFFWQVDLPALTAVLDYGTLLLAAAVIALAALPATGSYLRGGGHRPLRAASPAP
ncbi:hypothetical protein [Kutzneria buriramensis]|uniref:DoxX-like protein n=1 Tax=Kutzneria buriramensis TaxID=1045776 RepID=A0A3E0HBV3_9PSEU|nr:hypothetical protein [Kutzneria buriramensis]REH41871.1 hypothetical protein BCF44_111175 [Kutzneria buriramensis]